MLVTQGTIRTLHTGFSTLFNGAMESATQDWGQVAQRVISTTRRNEFAWMRNIPQMKRDLGPKDFESLVRQGYTIENHRYGTFVEVDVDDIEDDNIGSYQLAFTSHSTEAADWLSKAVFSLLPMGLTTSGKSYDGENFFSAAHTKLESGATYSNFATDSNAPWYLLDTTRAVKPFILQERKTIQLTLKNQLSDDNVFEDDVVRWGIKGRYGFGYAYPQYAYCSKKTLNAANLEAAITAMMGQTRDDGTKVNIMPNLLVVGTSNHFAAKKLLENERDAAGATNVHKGTLSQITSQFVESVDLDIAPSGG